MALDELKGKRVVVFYHDGSGNFTISRKDGVLKSADASFVIISRTTGEEAIPVTKIVRVEVSGA